MSLYVSNVISPIYKNVWEIIMDNDTPIKFNLKSDWTIFSHFILWYES